jgi:hypothetical protein
MTARKSSLDAVQTKPRPRSRKEAEAVGILDDLPKAPESVVAEPAVAEQAPPTPPEQASAPAAPAPAVEKPQKPTEAPPAPPLDLATIVAIRKGNAREHTLQRNYRMPVSLLDRMDVLAALGYEFSAIVVAGTTEHVDRLFKKHGLE